MSKCECENCYWFLSGCKDNVPGCRYYYPNAFDDSFEAPELEYNARSNDPWEKAGFSVIDLNDERTRW